MQPQIGSLSHDTAVTNLIFCQHFYGTTGTFLIHTQYFTWYNIHKSAAITTVPPHTEYISKRAHKLASTVNSLPWSKFCYCLFRRNPPSHIRLPSLAFFCSTLTPTPSTHTISSRECKGQAYTVVQFPYRSGTSHKQLSKVSVAQSKALAIIQRHK